MTTAQKIRGSVTNPQQQEVAQWTKIFPPKIKSQQQSVLFVKKLLTVSLSNIAWLRSMFPEDVYADKSLGGLKIKTLKEKTDNEEAQTLTKWLIGAFDAIEKSYLREMVFFIYLDEQKPEDVYEKYTFHFKYDNGEAAFEMSKEDANTKMTSDMSNIRDKTRSLMRSIIAMTNSMDPLPKSAYVAIKLAYYDDVTPMDYEPEGFAATTLEEAPMAPPISVGGVATSHHGIKLSVATRLVKESAEAGGGIVNNNYISSQSQSQVEGGISCVCENSTTEDLMITCFGCNKAQHGACYRILSAEDVPAKHICVNCAEDNRPCTDQRLIKMIAKDPSLTTATCLYRRILVKLGKVEATTISMDSMLGPLHLHDQDANRFMQKLVKEGVLEANNQDDGSYDVCRTQLQSAMKRFLGVKTKEKTVDSIVSGTTQMELGESGPTTRMTEATTSAAGDTKTGVKRSIESPAQENTHCRTKRLKSKSKGALLI